MRQVVDRIVRPRLAGGRDWGADRWVICRKGQRELIWRPACGVDIGPGPSRLYCWRADTGVELSLYGGANGLSRRLLRGHAPAIDGFFGEPVTPLLDPERTLLLDEEPSARVQELLAEVARLRELVRSAYMEAKVDAWYEAFDYFEMGKFPSDKADAEGWEASKARRALG